MRWLECGRSAELTGCRSCYSGFVDSMSNIVCTAISGLEYQGVRYTVVATEYESLGIFI
jgi:hypothetical protein